MRGLLGVLLAAVVVIADQVSKSWIRGYFAAAPVGTDRVELTPFFQLVLTSNRGMSFGLFNRDSSWNVLLFSLLAAVVVAALFIWLWRSEGAWILGGVGLVAGGAIGNVIDRLRLGGVTDFLDFHWSEWHFPAFNLADSAISVGVCLLVIDGLLGRRESRN